MGECHRVSRASYHGNAALLLAGLVKAMQHLLGKFCERKWCIMQALLKYCEVTREQHSAALWPASCVVWQVLQKVCRAWCNGTCSSYGVPPGSFMVCVLSMLSPVSTSSATLSSPENSCCCT